MKKQIIIIVLLLSSLFSSDVIKIAPLPMVKSQRLLNQYIPMLRYLEKKTNLKFEIVYVSDYDQIIQKLIDSEIDIAFLGPLPYVEITKRCKSIIPLVRFLNSKGEEKYTCSLFSLDNSSLKLSKLRDKKVALTQKYSTCGFLAVEQMLQKNQNSLKNSSYNFMGSHSNAVLEVVLGNYELGGAKSSIVKSYQHIGLKILATSQKFPGFVFAAKSKNLSNQTLIKIKKALMDLKPLTSKKDREITKEWGKNLKYGVVEAKDDDYNIIREILQKIELPK